MTVTNSSSLQNTDTPWEYLNFNNTSKVWNSSSKVAKYTRRSIVGISVIAIIEAIIKIVQIPFKFIGNLFSLYKRSFFKAKPSIQKIPSEEIKEPEKPTVVEITPPPQTTQLDQLKKTLLKEPKITTTPTWKKAFIIGAVIISGILLISNNKSIQHIIECIKQEGNFVIEMQSQVTKTSDTIYNYVKILLGLGVSILAVKGYMSFRKANPRPIIHYHPPQQGSYPGDFDRAHSDVGDTTPPAFNRDEKTPDSESSWSDLGRKRTE